MSQSDLSTNQARAIQALLACATIEKAAEQAGLSGRTVYRYLNEPTFKAALRARQDQVIAGAVAALAGLAGKSIETLRGVMEDPEAAQGVRTRAALGVLGHIHDMIELRDLAERVAALEARA